MSTLRVPRRTIQWSCAGVLLVAGLVRAEAADFVVTPNLTYATIAAPNQPAISLQLDLYQPTTASPPEPTIIWIHGGGWKAGSRTDVPPTVTALCANGYAVAAIDYRLSQQAKWPAQIQDCKAAVRWLRANASQFGLDPTHFAAWGESAGGHLVAMLGTSGGVTNVSVGAVDVSLVGANPGNANMSDRVQAVVDWYGPTDLLMMDNFPSAIPHDAVSSPESQLIGAPIQTQPQRTATANPMLYVSAGDPPFLIMHGTSDTQVPFNQSELLNATLLSAGVPVTFFPVVGGTHGGVAWGTTETVGTVHAFLDATIGAGQHGAPPPACDFTATISSSTSPATLTGNAAAIATGNGAASAWSFGDDAGLSGSPVAHAYNLPGQYFVTSAERDAQLDAASCTRQLDVEPARITTNGASFARIVSPGPTTPLTAGANVVVQAALADTNGVAKVEFYANGQYLGADSIAPYAVTWPSVPAGTYALTTRVIDVTGGARVSPPANVMVGMTMRPPRR